MTDYEFSDWIDIEILADRVGLTATAYLQKAERHKAAVKRYEKSEKGKTRQKRYNQTEAGKARWKRYEQSHREQINARRRAKRKENGGQ